MDKNIFRPKLMLVSSDETAREQFVTLLGALGCEALALAGGAEALGKIQKGFVPDILSVELEGRATNEFLSALKAESSLQAIELIPYSRHLQFCIVDVVGVLKQEVAFMPDPKNSTPFKIPGDLILSIAESLRKKSLRVPEPLQKAAAALQKYQ